MKPRLRSLFLLSCAACSVTNETPECSDPSHWELRGIVRLSTTNPRPPVDLRRAVIEVHPDSGDAAPILPADERPGLIMLSECRPGVQCRVVQRGQRIVLRNDRARDVGSTFGMPDQLLHFEFAPAIPVPGDGLPLHFNEIPGWPRFGDATLLRTTRVGMLSSGMFQWWTADVSGRFKLSIVNTDEAQSFVDVDVVDHAGVMTAREDGSFTFQMSDVERARLVVRHPDLGSVERTIEFTKAHDAEVVLDVPDPLRTPR